MELVVVGGGLAGHRALQALRGFAGTVTLVSDEEHKPYDRPPLSKQVLLGKTSPAETFLNVDGLDVDWVLGDGAVGLDVQAREVRLASGRVLSYDGLVIATGRRARAWPGELPDLEGFHTLRSLDDAIALQHAAAGARSIAIVGAGFVGCEVAASMRRQGVEEVTLIDVADQPMPGIGARAGAMARKRHEDAGVRFRLSATVTGFKGENGRVSAVELAGDNDVPADLVLLALGSSPNSEWLDGTPIERYQGNVVCDEHLFVKGAEDVVAAGDVVAWSHPHAQSDQGLVCIEHWTTSREMAKVAVTNLLATPDQRTTFVSVPTFWSDQYDVKIKAAGYLHAADRFETVEADDEEPRLIVEAFADDELVGAIIFNKSRAFIDYQKHLRQALAESCGVEA